MLSSFCCEPTCVRGFVCLFLMGSFLYLVLLCYDRVGFGLMCVCLCCFFVSVVWLRVSCFC